MPAPLAFESTAAERRSTVVYMGEKNRYSEEDDDVSDDPAWYHAPRGSLQPAFPMSVLQKHESQRTNSTASESDVDPISPQWDTSPNAKAAERRLGLPSDASSSDGKKSNQLATEEEEEEDEDDHGDYFPPVPGGQAPSAASRPSRPSLQISTQRAINSPPPQITSPPGRKSAHVPVQLRPRGSGSKLSDVKRLSLERLSDSDAPRQSFEVNTARPSLARNRSAPRMSYGNQRMSMDMRSSMDLGGRESMMNYRPSDMNAQDLKSNFLTRDSLADGALHMSRGSISHMPRQSDAELPELLRAAKTGNLLLLKACLQDRDTDLTQRDAVHGQTALHLAVRNGQFGVVRSLCQKKTTMKLLIDAVDSRDNTPLHLAAARSRRITKFLLEQCGADVTRINARGQTPLGVHIITTRRDEPLIAEMLLQHNSDANAQLDGSTLLHKAVDLKLYEIACRLVRYGARLDIKDENGKMVFDKVNRKVLRQLINKISFPPVWVPDEERSHCMLCSRKFSKFRIGVRRHHCRHCGRICCGQCSHVSVESVVFPKSFEDRLKQGSAAANDDKKRVCKTCSSVFKERETPQEQKTLMGNFMQKTFGLAWEEVGGQQNAPRRSSLAN